MTLNPNCHRDLSRSPRLTILTCLLVALFVAVEWRLIHLQVLRHAELEEKAEMYQLTTRTEQSWRGEIQDCNGTPLAVTVPVRDIYADLTIWTNRVELLAGVVAPLLGTNQASLAQRVNQRLLEQSRRASDDYQGAVLVKRDVAPDEWAAIQQALARATFGLNTNKLTTRQRTVLKSLRRWALFAVNGQRRYYPYGEWLAPVLGFVGTGTNGHLLQGKWGLEASLDPLLAGSNGLCASSQDAAGNELAFCRTTDFAAHDGAQAVLTIDLTLQKIVEQALAKAVARYHPSNASCIVIRPQTGEILAMASLPAFNPQDPGGCPPAGWRNHAISDRNEVGSVFKAITLATALDHNVVNLGQPIYCENGLWIYKKVPLRDDDHHYGRLSVLDCFAKSSNIGFAKIGLLIGTNALYKSILRFGFDQPTGVPLPYETTSIVHSPANWSATAITRMPIGHELTVSQMQLVMAYAAIANNGRLMRPMLVKQWNHPDGTLWGRYEPQMLRTVISPETARLVREAMRAVVEHGTGQLAAMPGYSVSGKTGTAQKSDGHKLLPGHYYCSFVGMIPEEKPELVIAVAVDDPGNNAYGGTVAAPVFREIAEQAVVRYGIPPDLAPAPLHPGFLARSLIAAHHLVALAR